jgi:hypothetical protein
MLFEVYTDEGDQFQRYVYLSGTEGADEGGAEY